MRPVDADEEREPEQDWERVLLTSHWPGHEAKDMGAGRGEELRLCNAIYHNLCHGPQLHM